MEKVTCDICGRKFKTEDALKQHKNDAHKQAPSTETKEHHHKKGMPVGKILAIVIPILIIAGIGYGIFWALTTKGVGSPGSQHIHADFSIYLNNKQITPLPSSYFVRSPFMHVESGPGEGSVLHMHATGVPLRMFFDSVGAKFDSECFDIGTSRNCNSGNDMLKMFVKHLNSTWQQNFEYEKYVFSNLDKILITYGNETENQITAQQNNVTDFSKDNSGKVMPVSR